MGTYSILRQPDWEVHFEKKPQFPNPFKDIILFVSAFRKCVASKLWIILSKQKTNYSKSKLASCLDNQKVLPHLKPITAASKIFPDFISNSSHSLLVIFLNFTKLNLNIRPTLSLILWWGYGFKHRTYWGGLSTKKCRKGQDGNTIRIHSGAQTIRVIGVSQNAIRAIHQIWKLPNVSYLQRFIQKLDIKPIFLNFLQ